MFKGLTLSIATLALAFLSLASKAESQVIQPCATIYTSNTGFLLAALKESQVENVVSVSINRTGGPLEASVTIRADDSSIATFDVKQLCSGEVVATLKKPVTPGYVCKNYVDCMPRLGNSPEGKIEYCTKQYFDWAKVNCETQPQKLY